MTVPVSAVDDAIVAFASMLRERPGLAGVNVYEEPQRPDLLGVESIVVATRVESDQAEAQLGALTLEESFVLHGTLMTTIAGAGDADARAARQRAYALLGEIKTLLRTKHPTDATQSGLRLGGTVAWCRLAHFEYQAAATDALRVAEITFDVECRARLVATA